MKDARTVLLTQKLPDPAIAGKAIRVRVRLFFKRPKSHFKKDGTLKASAPIDILKRPDVDNCLKFILDSLQPAVMIDDKLVVEDARLENYFNRSVPLPKKGPIQLQTHGGEIRWRNVFLKELTPSSD